MQQGASINRYGLHPYGFVFVLLGLLSNMSPWLQQHRVHTRSRSRILAFAKRVCGPRLASHVMIALALLQMLLLTPAGAGSIGVDYGRDTNHNLISPQQVVSLLKSKGISMVRIYDTDSGVLKAFANSGIRLTVGIGNPDVPGLATDLNAAKTWVNNHIAPYSAFGISAIVVGNEWFLDTSLNRNQLLPAMQNVYMALQALGLDGNIKVSTSHAFNVISTSFPPSAGAFDSSLTSVMKPLIDFLRSTGSFFLVNIYPYYSPCQSQIPLDYCLFQPSATPVRDSRTNLMYHNLFDAQVDSVYAAIASLETGSKAAELGSSSLATSSIELHVLETGWGSGSGGGGLASIQNAQTYNQNLVNHVLQSTGTPANARPLTAYIFELFDTTSSNDHFGLFNPDGTPVYGINFG